MNHLISVVDLPRKGQLFACSMNCVTSMFIFQIENISSIYLFQASDFERFGLKCVILPFP
jgi:hypothetical protein